MAVFFFSVLAVYLMFMLDAAGRWRAAAVSLMHRACFFKQVLNVKKKCIYSELAGDGSRRRRELSSRFRRKSAFWYQVLKSYEKIYF